MKDLTKIYIDLSKLSEEEQKHIFSLLPEKEFDNQHHITPRHFHLSFDENDQWWVLNHTVGKTELTYPEFIKLFEGREDNNGWIKIESEADLPKESHIYWTLRKGFVYPMYVVVGDEDIDKKYWLDNYSHYQPIIKPEPPKF